MKHLKVILLAALVSAPFATRAQEAPQKTTFDASGWLVTYGFQNAGQFDAAELPRYRLNETVADQKSEGFAARESRIRAGLTVPTDNLLASSVVKGLLEVDFMGGTPSAASSVDPTIIRLRHAYFAATWKKAANLTLTVGQTWGVAQGMNFADSLAHLAVPRFGGAGFLYRRAPQVRVSADVPAGILTVNLAAGVLAPGDISSAASNSAGNASATPNMEAKVGATLKTAGVLKSLNVNFLTHYGQERYLFAGNTQDATATSQLFELEGKADFGIVSVLGGIWTGQNLDVYNSIAGYWTALSGAAPTVNGVVLDDVNFKAHEIETQGAYAQAGVTPVKGLLLVAGYGYENPKDSTLALPGATPAANLILRNTQYSAGAILNLTSKWRVSFEATRFLTQRATGGGNSDTVTGNQFQLGSLFAL